MVVMNGCSVAHRLASNDFEVRWFDHENKIYGCYSEASYAPLWVSSDAKEINDKCAQFRLGATK